MRKYTEHNFGHDELDYAANVFKLWKWAQKPDLHWPIAFGPFPGLRTHRLVDGPSWSFMTASVKFRTSRTFLETLFPTPQFRFKAANTICLASFCMTRWDKPTWPGGEHSCLGLYVHGVEYVKKDGTTVVGSYMPVVFDSHADSIIASGEELGLPKLFCDVSVDRRPDSCRIVASWGGTQFARLILPGLKEDDRRTEQDGEADVRVLVNRYIPAVGQPGKADVEYACVLPHTDAAMTQSADAVSALARSQNATIEVDAGNWDSLPTLHHVTSILAEIPIYEVVGAKVVEGTGVPSLISRRRIE